jgi:hypothetical protein
MKRTVIILSLIFALVIALSVSIPTLALDDTETTVITGTVPLSINITAHPGDFDLGTLTLDTQIQSGDKTVSVKCNKAGWTLTVAETSGDGFMANGSTPLTEPLYVKGGHLSETYTGLNTSPSLETSGAKGTVDITDIEFAQTSRDADTAGIYTITVTFTATIN